MVVVDVVQLSFSSLVPRPRPRRVGIKDLGHCTALTSSPSSYRILSTAYTSSPCDVSFLLVCCVYISCCPYWCCCRWVSLALSPPAPEGWDKDITAKSNTHCLIPTPHQHYQCTTSLLSSTHHSPRGALLTPCVSLSILMSCAVIILQLVCIVPRPGPGGLGQKSSRQHTRVTIIILTARKVP